MGRLTLNDPAALWWLLPTLAALWLLAQPPRPRRALWTAHPAQWRLAEATLRRRPPRFRAWRWLLLCVGCALAGLAAAAPRLQGLPGMRRAVVLVDGSASMAAKGKDGLGALERALAECRAALARLPAAAPCEVALVGDAGLRRWSGAAARSLADTMTAKGESPAPLAELAASASAEGAWVLVFTDGQDPSALPAGVAVSMVGEPLDNAALADVALEDRWPQREMVVRGRIVAFGRDAMRGELRISGAIEATEPIAFVLPHGGESPFEVVVQRLPEGGALRLEVSAAGDALAADDRFVAQLPPLPQTRIAVQADGEGQRLARTAAQALAAAVGGEVTDSAAAADAAGAFWILEGGRGAAPSVPMPMLSFGRGPEGAAVWPAPAVVDWNRLHPLLAGLDFSGLDVAFALAGALPPGEPLMSGQMPDGTTAPLCVLQQGEDGAAVHFAFRLADCNLALLAAFPQLLLRVYERAQRPHAAIEVLESPPALSESDISALPARRAASEPTWATEDQDLAPACLCAALLLLALRTLLR